MIGKFPQPSSLNHGILEQSHQIILSAEGAKAAQSNRMPPIHRFVIRQILRPLASLFVWKADLDHIASIGAQVYNL